MADTPESRPPFWSSLPGIFTGLGGVIVAVATLITALYQTGVIGSKSNSNSVPAVNSTATLASAPGALPSNADNDRYKSLGGKWEVVAKGSCFTDIKETVYKFDAEVSGNELKFRGGIISLDGDKNLTEADEKIQAVLVMTLSGLGGVGDLKETYEDGGSSIFEASIRLDEEQRKFRGTVGDPPCTLNGSKL